MKKIIPCILICLFATIIKSKGQDSLVFLYHLKKPSLGLGGGLDYGGFGVNLLVYADKNIGFFGGVGYALAGPGYNAGIKYRFVSNNPTSKSYPYLLAMYGYNAAIAVTNATKYNKLFYGPTLGVGFDFSVKQKKNSFWTIALLVPIRNSEVNNYINDLKNNKGVKFSNELLPIAISIGFRISI